MAFSCLQVAAGISKRTSASLTHTHTSPPTTPPLIFSWSALRVCTLNAPIPPPPTLKNSNIHCTLSTTLPSKASGRAHTHTHGHRYTTPSLFYLRPHWERIRQQHTVQSVRPQRAHTAVEKGAKQTPHYATRHQTALCYTTRHGGRYTGARASRERRSSRRGARGREPTRVHYAPRTPRDAPCTDVPNSQETRHRETPNTTAQPSTSHRTTPRDPIMSSSSRLRSRERVPRRWVTPSLLPTERAHRGLEARTQAVRARIPVSPSLTPTHRLTIPLRETRTLIPRAGGYRLEFPWTSLPRAPLRNTTTSSRREWRQVTRTPSARLSRAYPQPHSAPCQASYFIMYMKR